jgi:AcrR family transcriptional regulator
MAAVNPGTVDVVAADQEKRAPGRPRSARVDEAIIEAVLDLLAEGTTIEALSIESVATRAGVGKATIYRRWANKEELIVDAVASLKGPVPQVAGDSVRGDLVTLLNALKHNQLGRAGRIMPCLVPEIRRNPRVYERWQLAMAPRKQVLREVLERGVRTGELRADLDIDIAVLMLNGPMLIQMIMNWDPNLSGDGLAERVVDSVLAGIGA